MRIAKLPILTLYVVSVLLIALTKAQETVEPSTNKPSPYDSPPAVEAPYYRVRYEASSQPDELVYPVAYTVWIPPEVKTLRGVVVHQHGCGEGSCKSGQTGAFDLHWQALARAHDCALLSPVYEQLDGDDCQLWCDPRHGSDRRFQLALVDLAALTGHSELPDVPWALWGHSGGGHWAGGMLLLHPERVAAAWLRSGVPLLEKSERGNIQPHDLPLPALQVPVMCNLGTKEGFSESDKNFASVWPGNKAFFDKMRSAGGLIGVAVDPFSSHDCGNQRYLAIPWLDACLSARLPNKVGETLRPIDSKLSWLASLPNPAADVVDPVAANEFRGDIAQSVWLPNETIAQAWSKYARDSLVSDSSPPPAPTDVRLDGDHLTWQAQADLESGLAHFIIELDGVEIGKVEGPVNHFGRRVFQGLQYSDTPATPLVDMRYRIENASPASADRYRVRTVNTAQLMSP